MDGSRRHIMTWLPDTGKAVLMTFAGKCKYLTVTGRILSGISAIITLMPCLCMWMIIKLVVLGQPRGLTGGALVYWGWMAVAPSFLSMLIYFRVLMCTHLSAFQTARDMKTIAPHHLAGLPTGYLRGTRSGEPRRTINDGAKQTETYLVHQLPDLAGASVTPVTALVLLLVSDWGFDLISLIPVTVSTFFLSRTTGMGMAEHMKQCQSALEDMNSETVEYVHGILVARVFQQNTSSLKSFHNSIIRYKS